MTSMMDGELPNSDGCACDVGTTCGEDDGVTVDAVPAATHRCGGRTAAAAAATSNDCNVFLLSIHRPSGQRNAVPAVVLPCTTVVGENKWAFWFCYGNRSRYRGNHFPILIVTIDIHHSFLVIDRRWVNVLFD